MIFYSQLYIGENVRHSKRILHRLKKGIPQKDTYIITLAAGKDLLEIYDMKVLCQKQYRDFDRPVIGLASSYDEAVSLIIQITQECFAYKGDCDLKSYLLERETKK
ncbi:MAG: hypothetical protein E7293_03665 [Lachnospiraceae bacterium]|nr:hypothetical protein [Lachnospiraceae bacterium]